MRLMEILLPPGVRDFPLNKCNCLVYAILKFLKATQRAESVNDIATSKREMMALTLLMLRY